MAETIDRPASLSTLPGATVIRRIRRMAFAALGTALVYSVIGAATRGGCVGGSTADGFMEVNGSAADITPTCVQLTLRPSWIVFVAIAVTVIVAITLILRPGRSEASALRIIDRAVAVMIAGTLAWAALTMVSFFAIPLDPPSPGEPFMIPFTLGQVEVDLTP
ncbi:hypothetical protein [Agromyces italicus]|uniref:hypothetical protein n=1 Tax=Agromyces italicus TaxID=279572 RepID=UPI0003B58A39|nr:hypothetical protein [Agromyces italicus]